MGAIITTLSELFAKTVKRPDLKSDVTSKYLPDFHNHILNHKDKKELLVSDDALEGTEAARR